MSYLGLKYPINNDTNYLFNVSNNSKEWIDANIRNLLLTIKGERLLNIDFGCDFLQLLFENDTIKITEILIEEVENCFDKYLPNIELVSINGEIINDYVIKIIITYKYYKKLYTSEIII